MPKPMTMTIEVEEIAFGKIFRTLDGMPGVVNIRIAGSGPKTAAAAKSSTAGQKQGGAQTVPCIVLGTLIENKTPLGRPELFDAVESYGKHGTSLPDALQKLRRAKAIKSTGSGRTVTYKITPVGVKQFETACSIQPLKE